MRLLLNEFEMDRLLEAVHYYVMHLREMETTGSNDYTTLVGIEKFLLDSTTLEISNNLPF